MRVRLKSLGDNGALYTVIEESPSFYVVESTGGFLTVMLLLPKFDYEPVTEWVDVTSQVRESQFALTYTADQPDCVEVAPGYRLRKLSMKELHDWWQGKDEPCALILERRA